MAYRFLCLYFSAMMLLSNFQVIAQQQKNYLFTRYGKINGLGSDETFSVTQDRQGYIWIATGRGLQRYDGKKFVTFYHDDADPASISSNAVGGLYTDTKGRLWVLFYGNKLGIFNTHTLKFSPVKLIIPDEFKRNDMLNLHEDENGVLQISIGGYGVLTYNDENNEFSSVHNLVQLNNKNNPLDIYKLRSKEQYLIVQPFNLDIYDRAEKKWLPRNSNAMLQTFNKISAEEKGWGPGHITTDSKGRIWMDVWFDGKTRTGPDIYCYNPADNSFTSFKNSVDIAAHAYHSIDGIREQKNGDIWIYGTSLFARFNEEKKIFEDVRNGLLNFNEVPVETVFNIYEDREANLWLSTSNGLFMFNPGRQVFTNLPNIRSDGRGIYRNSVDAVLQSRTGTIFTTSWGGGIFAYDNNFNVIPNPIIPEPKANYAFSGWDLHERANGEIWIAKQGGSVSIYDPKTHKLTNLKLSVFEGRTVRQLAEDSSGNMWMGTQYGLIVKCTNSNWHDTAAAFKIVQRLNGRITKIVSDKKGFIWVSADRYGLYKLKAADGSIVDHYDKESSREDQRLKEIGANDIFVYNDSIVLIASGGLNVLNTRTNKINYINVGNLPGSTSLTSIIRDRQGFLWLAFSDGICRMEFGKNIFLYFGYEDGILHSNFQINASTVLNDGRILFGTATDMLVFDPMKITLPKKPVPVTISGFQVADRDLLVDSLLRLKKISLPYYKNSFAIDITTFSYLNDYGIMYMLEGVDKKWLSTSTNRMTYPLLQPGTYKFKAKTISAYGEESETVTELVIEIVPPFWNTWWFYGLLALSGIAIFYLADRERLLRIKATQKLRTDIALNLHHDVNSTLNNINLLSEMARMKIDKDTSRSKLLIEQISEKSNNMMIAMDDMLWSIDPANDSMEKTILRMAEFIDSLRNRHEADIVIHIDEKVKELKLDMKSRHGFFIIFKAALRCMVQYSGAKNCLINIDLQKNNMSLKMQGSTRLAHKDPNILNCMEEMKTHAAEINAELDAQNEKTGSSIVLIMPL